MKHEASDAELLEICSLGGLEDIGGHEEDNGVVILDASILHQGKEYDRLNLCEPSLYDVLGAAQVIGKRPSLQSIYDSQIALVAKAAGVPQMVIQKLPSRALDRAVEYVTAFERGARREIHDPDLQDGLDLRPEKVLIFRESIPGGGKEFSEMRLREPSVAERRRFKSGEGAGTIEAALRAEMALVEEISEWHRAALLRLPISKFAEAADYVTGFFIPGPPIGTAYREI
ncbi:phage tail assembly protein [Gluconobacter sp. LMG 1744]|uniref:phage tail assembly protein n=1 Tax=Gluconobacter cadivus TaxID=2728101 RepID=UPI001884CC23|nr:phage tail assembly protein [Gluconobacter cadivus]MBF0892204.1 phage tail assembly protein [Gluconobacter cadivus]